MPVCDEERGHAEIRALGKDGKNILSHHIRNGLMIILAASDCPRKVEGAVWEFEKRLKELGL